MVARVTTLRAAGGRLAGLVEYYAGLAKDRTKDGPGRGPADYYLDAGEPPGRWHGAGLEALGLGVEVSGDELRALLTGEHPVKGATLGRSFGDKSARGFDVTFSAPKSVSVLWALHPDEHVRDAVAASHDAAVAATVDWIETHGAVTRRGRSGVHQVDAHGLAVAVFRQHTSRTADPQLHSHAIVASKVQDDTGKWLSLDARWLTKQQRSISWVYDAALRAELSQRTGVEWEVVAEGAGQSDIVGVPGELLEVFSKRSGQVEAKLAELIGRWRDEHDGAEPSARDIAILERRAVIASRPAKQHGVDADALRRDWHDQALAAGLDPSALPGTVRERDRVPGNVPGFVPGSGLDIDRELLVETAIARAASESATWLPTDLSRRLAALLPTHDTSAAQLIATVDELTEHAVARCRALHPEIARSPRRRDGRPVGEAVTDRRLTTTAVWDEEERLLAWAARSVDRGAPVEAGPIGAAAAMAGTAPLVLVVGPAGTGKTTAVAVAVRKLESRGRAVIGLAPSGKAADVLESETGCPSVTLAKLLHDARHDRPLPERGTTVVVDEAGMAATDDLAQLAALAERHGWRVVAVGDPAQLPAVGRAGMFAQWCDTLPAVHLDAVYRFTNPWEAQASLQLRAGNPEAVAAYDDHHRLRATDPALLADNVADQHARLEARGRTIAITTATQSTARTINIEIQRRRQHTGRHAPLADGTSAYAGDTIATRRNDPALTTTNGDTVRNRHTWTVDAVNADGTLDVSRLEHGTVRLPAGYVAEHVELGWAVTGYGNQGITADAGIAIIEPAASRAHIYVAMTRGRERNVAWIPDPTGTLDPAQVLADAIARPTTALTAHQVRQRLHEDHGLEVAEEAPQLSAPARTPSSGLSL
jgi:conjugative relaxase-like TrwC/TraI family protein